jgi:ribosome-associated heat shock protein Hsp15
MRLDLWLWAVRTFKTRSLAAGAIRGGRVKVGEQTVKPAHTVRVGQIIAIRVDSGSVPWLRTLKALGLPPSRVGAKLVPLYAEDLTTEEEMRKSQTPRALEPGFRAPGLGRPTKSERRALEGFYDW